MATLVIDDKRFPFPHPDMSRYVMDTIDDDDTDVLILVGTPEETVNAVESFGVLRELCDLLDAFNNPKEGDTVETMKGLKGRIASLYTRFKHLIDGNRVYDLLYPANEVVKKVVDYEKGTSVAGWYKDKELHMKGVNEQLCEACKKGHETIARWLHSLGVDIHVDDDVAFRWACCYGHEIIARWLHSLGVDIHARDDYAFYWACAHGHESIARWLHSLGVDIHTNDDDAFRWACAHGHESIARWLHSLGGVDIHADDDAAFQMACTYGYESIAHWLRELGCE